MPDRAKLLTLKIDEHGGVLEACRVALIKFLGLCGVLLAAGLATGGAKAQEAAVKELIPTGKLRFGVAFAPKMSALFVVKDAGGSPRGVTVDLGNELAQRLGVPIEFMVAGGITRGTHVLKSSFRGPSPSIKAGSAIIGLTARYAASRCAPFTRFTSTTSSGIN